MIYAGVAIVYCLHGDEIIGKDIASLLKEKYKEVAFVEGSPEAIKKNIRFIEKDLNRAFPGKIDGCYEEKRAAEILENLQEVKFVIDIHQTSSCKEPFLIFTKATMPVKLVLGAFPVDNAVYMFSSIASGKALIDHVDAGVSVEFPRVFALDDACKIIEEAIASIRQNREHPKIYFRVIKKLSNPGLEYENIENFRLVKKDSLLAHSDDLKLIASEEFYPIFYGEKKYQDFLCLKSELASEKIFEGDGK